MSENILKEVWRSPEPLEVDAAVLPPVTDAIAAEEVVAVRGDETVSKEQTRPESRFDTNSNCS